MVERTDWGSSPEKERIVYRVMAIHVGTIQGGPMEPRDSVIIDENGVVDGRYPFNGYYSGKRIPDEDRGVTLISAEGVARANEELQIHGIEPFDWGDTRRDFVVTMSPEVLNSLKVKDASGQRVRIGGATLEATDPCTPCVHLAELRSVAEKDRPKVVKAFLKNGGMRFRVIEGGVVSINSEVEVLDGLEYQPQ